MIRQLKTLITKDGSITIFNEGMNETYHSTHGAIQESMHVFIANGLSRMDIHKSPVHVFEVGLGTGLNVLLSYQYALQNNIRVIYHSIEPEPLKADIYKKLNYEEIIPDPFLKGITDKIHSSGWGEEIIFNENFTFIKFNVGLLEFNTEVTFDMVFYDAFAPSKQPEMWDIQNFAKVFSMMNHGGTIVSYCASGQFKRNLKACGFITETLKGPPGKLQMTKGFKS